VISEKVRTVDAHVAGVIGSYESGDIIRRTPLIFDVLNKAYYQTTQLPILDARLD
jgi:hypothetical protein